MDPSDFPIGVEPVRGADALIYNPWLWIAALLLALLIFWMGLHWGKLKAEEKREAHLREVVDRIYKAINDKARAAAAAPRHQLVTAAHALSDEIRNLIGPVVALTPFGRRAIALRDALAGRPASRDHGDDDHDSHDAADASHGEGAHASAEHASTGGALAAAAGAAHVNISIGGNAGSGGHATGHGSGHATPPDAVRAAVMDVCDYWSRTTMKAELRAAQQALLTMPPAAPKAHGGHASH